MATSVSVSASSSQDINGVLSGVKWNTNSLSFSFPESGGFYEYSESQPFSSAFNPTQQNAARQALAMFSAVANLTLNEVTESASTHADLRFANNAASTAYAYYPSGTPRGGDSWYGPSMTAPAPGSYSYTSIIHEIGHAFGLKHGQETNVYGALPTNHDSAEYSVMTYRSYVGSPGSFYTIENGGGPQSLMQDDIAALQYMYGANFAYNAGNTVYQWSPVTGEMTVNGVGTGANTANRIFRTIWDGGGVDAYDLSNYTTNVTINLNPGAWSTFDVAQLSKLNGSSSPARGNVANALLYNNNPASLIEIAIGGSGNDTLIGNTVSNSLVGNDGADTLISGSGGGALIGGAGNDVLWFYGANAQIDGGAGFDYAIQLDNSAQNRNIGAAGIEIYLGNSNNDTVSGVGATASIIIYGGAGADTLTSGDYGSYLFGQDGADILVGGFGADNLLGGPGADSIAGGSGDDVLYIDSADGLNFDGGDGIDYAIVETATAVNLNLGGRNIESFVSNNGGDVIDASAVQIPMALYGGGGNDWIVGAAAGSQIFGMDGADVLFGGPNGDVIIGGAGADQLRGGGGDDQLYIDRADTIWDGGDGYDTLYVVDNAGANINIAAWSIERVLVFDAYGASTVISNASSSTAVSLYAGPGAASLTGGANDDFLYGGPGSDLLIGGLGNDTIAGGGGDDIIRFNAADVQAGYTDTINGFGDTFGDADIIDLSGISADNVLITDGAGGAAIIIGGIYTIIVAGFTAAAIADDILFS